MSNPKQEISARLRKHDVYIKNPFAREVGLTDILSYRRQKEDSVFNFKGDAIKTYLIIEEETKADNERFIIFYRRNIKMIFDLSATSFKVFEYILDVLKPNKDTIIFNAMECKKRIGWRHKKSVYDGLYELLDKEMLARTETKNLYYINVAVFFNGNRFEYIKRMKKREGDPIPRIEVKRTRKVAAEDLDKVRNINKFQQT